MFYISRFMCMKMAIFIPRDHSAIIFIVEEDQDWEGQLWIILGLHSKLKNLKEHQHPMAYKGNGRRRLPFRFPTDCSPSGLRLQSRFGHK